MCSFSVEVYEDVKINEKEDLNADVESKCEEEEKDQKLDPFTYQKEDQAEKKSEKMSDENHNDKEDHTICQSEVKQDIFDDQSRVEDHQSGQNEVEGEIVDHDDEHENIGKIFFTIHSF